MAVMTPSIYRRATTIASRHAAASTSAHDARWLATIVIGAAFVSVVAMVSIPASRSAMAAFGGAPLWLLALPLTSLVAMAIAHRFDRSLSIQRRSIGSTAARRPRLDTVVQPRRRAATPRRSGAVRAA